MGQVKYDSYKDSQLGQFLTNCCRVRGITFKSFIDKMGGSKATVYRVCRGFRNMTDHLRYCIIRALELSHIEVLEMDKIHPVYKPIRKPNKNELKPFLPFRDLKKILDKDFKHPNRDLFKLLSKEYDYERKKN